MRSEITVGIDPGLGGAIAWHDGIYHVTEMPVNRKIVTYKGKRKAVNEVDETAIYNLLNLFKSKGDVECIVEHQQFRNEDLQGGKLFNLQKLVQNYKSILTILKILEIKTDCIRAATWQKKYDLPVDYSLKKRKLVLIAKEKFARLKPTAKTADALLILSHKLILKSYESVKG